MQTLGKMHRAFADRSVRVPCRCKRRTTDDKEVSPYTSIEQALPLQLRRVIVRSSDPTVWDAASQDEMDCCSGMARKRHIKSWRCGRATRVCCDKAKRGVCLLALTVTGLAHADALRRWSRSFAIRRIGAAATRKVSEGRVDIHWRSMRGSTGEVSDANGCPSHHPSYLAVAMTRSSSLGGGTVRQDPDLRPGGPRSRGRRWWASSVPLSAAE